MTETEKKEMEQEEKKTADISPHAAPEAGNYWKIVGRKSKREVIFGFFQRSMDDHLNAYAAEAAYFLFLSFIPFVLFLTTLIRFTNLSYDLLMETITSAVPSNLQGFVMKLVEEVYSRSSATLPISLVVVLWSAGRAVQSMINGLNTIYHVRETRNWLVNRIYAVFYTLLFGIAILGSIILVVLGRGLQSLLEMNLPFLGGVLGFILERRSLIVLLVLFVIFVFLYRFLPNRYSSFRAQMPGAAFVAVFWMLFSHLFALYFRLFPSVFNMYGSLTALVIMMIWLYYCMTLVLGGAEINIYFESQFRLIHHVVKTRSREKKKNRKREARNNP